MSAKSNDLSFKKIFLLLPFQEKIESLLMMLLYFGLRQLRTIMDALTDLLGWIWYWPKRNHLPSITNDLLLQSTSHLLREIRSGNLKCETLVKAYIDRIEKVNPLINALVYNCFDRALEEARDYDRRIENVLSSANVDSQNDQQDRVLELPLLGIPVSVKESIAVKDYPMTCGLYSRKDCKMDYDAKAVTNLRKAGAIVIGKQIGGTNVPEFLLWWDTNNRLYGSTNNPYDLSRISGGSSGGEAALISSAGSLIGIGSDIGGSIRIPTFFCGIFGHKPTSHVVDLHGCFPYCGHQIREKFLVIGPICRYAVDLKPTLKCMIGDDHKTLERLNLDSPVDLKKSKFYFLYEDGDPFKTKVSNEIKNGIKNVRNFLENSLHYQCEDIELSLLRKNFFIWLTNLSDCDAPSLAEELTERKYKLNGYVELLKSILGLSHFRKISCLNVIGESLIYSQERRKSPQFRSLINDGIKLREQLCSLLGKMIT
ncbi:Fatty-acid amide hydrolase 2 [Sarcoptes scabiei]|uniref:Fatty-acid amide hydrolase 2 n=1 Tax=Sarcoptes scabiei TaxID=52283 RepID=A0A834R9Q5_SARSC|nr:Fatty-acid amide hydrolase 2 [Sarcoptes scabiei]